MREEGKLQSLVFSQSPPSLSVHYTADIYMIHVLIAHSTQFIVLYEAKVHISKQYYSVLTHVIVVSTCSANTMHRLGSSPSLTPALWAKKRTGIDCEMAVRGHTRPLHYCILLHTSPLIPASSSLMLSILSLLLSQIYFFPIVSSEHSCPQFPVG